MSGKSNFDLNQFVSKWLAPGEVKTPLAFFFKVLPWLTGIWGLILYAPIPSDLKLYLVKLASLIFCGMFVFVGIFAWFNPSHLIYGEASHRAKAKATLDNQAALTESVRQRKNNFKAENARLREALSKIANDPGDDSIGRRLQRIARETIAPRDNMENSD